MPFWSEPRSDECNFLSLKLSTLCSALMNSFVPSTNQVLPLLEQLTQRTRDRGKLLQSPLHPHAFNPTATTHGNFVLSPVSLASRDQDGGPSDSTIMQHLRSHGKIGDCEQSTCEQAPVSSAPIWHVLKPGTPEHRNTGTPEHRNTPEQRNTPEHPGKQEKPKIPGRLSLTVLFCFPINYRPCKK